MGLALFFIVFFANRFSIKSAFEALQVFFPSTKRLNFSNKSYIRATKSSDMNHFDHGRKTGWLRYLPLLFVWLAYSHLNEAKASQPEGMAMNATNCSDPTACNYTPFSGPGYCVQIDTYATHSAGALAGMTTYRVYALCENTDDFVNTVTGDSNSPAYIRSTTSFYQNAFGGNLAQNINPIFFGLVPELAFDSWITIGLTSAPVGAEGAVSTIGSGWIPPFEAGGNIEISDNVGGGWYILPGSSNGVAGDDYRVLLGQFTTNGALSGQVLIQFFENGIAANYTRRLINFADACVGPVVTDGCNYPDGITDCSGACIQDTDGDGVCDELEVAGCTDVFACNFDALATDPDLTACTYPAAGLDCAGNCLNDLDGDGTCDEVEVPGCTDAVACNFDASATEENGTCTYPLDQLNCAGECLVDSDDDGVCDAFEIAGCTDALACNFDASATDNDGSCTFPAAYFDCAGECLADTDGDGICDPLEILGCTLSDACNYNPEATDSNNGSCTYPADGLNCDGSCVTDSDGDGVCNFQEVAGCTNASASNFNPLATDDDGSCFDPTCNDPSACNYSAPAEQYCLSIEVFAQHSGMVGSSDLTGYTTYRVYANTATPGDFVSAVIGDEEFPLEVATTTHFFQQPMGSNVASGVNPLYIGLVPDLAFDSWLTVGLTGAPNTAAGEGAINLLPGSWLNAFAAGGNIEVNDAVGGGWYIFNGNSNGVAGADRKVLLGQFTTNGALSGSMYVQFFLNGSSSTPFNRYINFADACQPYDVSACAYAADGFDCAGNCLADADGDGVCDPFEVVGCQDATACNYDADATDSGDCSYAASGYDCDGNCLADADGDGVCDPFEVVGCQDDSACNYNADATDAGSCTYAAEGYDCDGNCRSDEDSDGVCDPFEVVGCQDATACNYDADATDAGDCTYADSGYDCDGNCLADGDGDGVCDPFEVIGCQDDSACNYNADATDAGSCNYAEEGYDCDGNCLADADGDGVCDPFEVVGCQDATACNYNASATDAGDCTYAASGYDCDGNCLADADGDGVCDPFEVVGCQDATACNYDAAATDAGDCTYADSGYDCDGICLADADGDGVCDPFEVVGCQDDTACNYNADATDAGSCTYAAEGYDCDGSCRADEDGDGVCDPFEVVGCQDATACNYDAAATDAGDCTYANSGYDCDGNCLADGDGDGVCDPFEVVGCQDATACNYDASSTDAGSCTYAANGYDCDGNCLADADGDGVCDPFEVVGCQDAIACNYDASATDAGSCTYAANGYDCDGNCLADADGDGVCDPFEVVGCQDATACNYDADATDAGSCTYAASGYDCDGNCLADADGDGVCDPFEVVGCQDATACNYDASATDAGSCIYAANGYDCAGNCLADVDGDGICDVEEIGGCTSACACNYNPEATEDDGSCFSATPIYNCSGTCWNDADGDGICDELENIDYSGLCGPGTVWSPVYGQCIAAPDDCPYDLNNDGIVQLQDLLDFLMFYGMVCD
jgi:hypothetical protein